MTVIAGVSLFDGVMMLSDCRVTVRRAGKADVQCDVAQKLFPLTQNAVIGYSGDVATAALLLSVLRRQLRKREHKDIASLVQWIPRLFQSGVATLRSKNKRVGQADFMLAGIAPDRANVVERAKVVELMRGIASGNSPIQRSFVPDIVMQVMMTPPIGNRW
jgi:20S proteasome alpha/beta subunit